MSRLFIEGKWIDLAKMDRAEVKVLKAKLESERASILFQLGDPRGKTPEWERSAREAYRIKGGQIHAINDFLATSRRKPPRR